MDNPSKYDFTTDIIFKSLEAKLRRDLEIHNISNEDINLILNLCVNLIGNEEIDMQEELIKFLEELT